MVIDREGRILGPRMIDVAEMYNVSRPYIAKLCVRVKPGVWMLTREPDATAWRSKIHLTDGRTVIGWDAAAKAMGLTSRQGAIERCIRIGHREWREVA